MQDRDLVRRYGRRLNGALALDALSLALAAGLFLAGLWILGTRLAAPEWIPLTPDLLCACAAGAVLAASGLAWRNRYRPEEVAAYADRHAAADGLLLTLRERPDPRWEPALRARTQRAALPAPRLGPPFRRLFPAALFAGLATFVPVRLPEWHRRLADAGRNAADRLQSQLDVLSREKLLTSEEERSLRAEVGRIEEDLEKGAFGAHDWEAADALRQRFEQKANRVHDALRGGAEALQETEREAAGDPAEWSLDDKTERQQELERALLEMNKENLFGKMPDGMRPEDLKRLQEWMGRMKADPNFNPALDPTQFRGQLALLREFLRQKGSG